MHGKILLSIIIPCYNAEKWIEKAIASVLIQADKRVELIVVNDGSTDNSLSIINKNSRYVVVVDQKNSGVGSARNKGISVSSGKFLKFLDADDEMPVGSIDTILTATQIFPDYVLVGRSNSIDFEGNIFDTVSYNIPRLFSNYDEIKNDFLFTQAVSSGLWILPKSVVNTAGGFEPTIRLGEEFLFTKRLVNTGVKFIFLDHVVNNVRCHDGPRLSRIATENDYLNQLACIQECFDRLVISNAGIDRRAKQLIGEMCWSLGRQCYRLSYDIAGDTYIKYARFIGGYNVSKGRLFYKLLVRVFDARKLETAMSKIKRLFR